MKIDDGGPAFPLPLGNENIDPKCAGMSLRDWFAGKAMAAIVGTYITTRLSTDADGEERRDSFHYRELCLDNGVGSVEIASDAYSLADAMLRERGKE